MPMCAWYNLVLSLVTSLITQRQVPTVAYERSASACVRNTPKQNPCQNFDINVCIFSSSEQSVKFPRQQTVRSQDSLLTQEQLNQIVEWQGRAQEY